MICQKCKIDKNEEEFYFRNKKENKKHKICKLCSETKRRSKEHYLKYKSSYVLRAKVRSEKIRQYNRKMLDIYKSNKKCTICGEDRKSCFDFHHINKKSKKFDISKAINCCYNWDKILEEINKCVIVCSNCHRVIHENDNK